MWYSQAPLINSYSSDLHYMPLARKLIVVFGCALLICLLTACGGTIATNQQSKPALASTPTFIPTPTNTPKPTPTPTPRPTSIPTPKPTQPPLTRAALAPTQPSPAPILDVAPSSMSIVGHLDCRRTASVFVCQAAVISGASNQTILHWIAFANIAGVGFSPAQGNLAPGTRAILTISIPVHECSGTFFFRGPINTHTINWQC